MREILNILTLGFFLSISSCGQTNTKNVIEKSTVNFDDVERIEIINNPLRGTNEKIELKELTNDQVKVMVDKWNNSKSKGLCKFGLRYWLFVTFKDESKRSFRANGQNIKEDNDWCYNIGDEQFFKKLYSNANPISSEKKKTFELIQGLWFHEQDSLASLTVNNYQWTFIYEGKHSNSDNNYSISLRDKLPEYVKETENAKFIILTSKTDTLEFEILGLTDSTFSMMYFPTGKIHLYRRQK